MAIILSLPTYMPLQASWLDVFQRKCKYMDNTVSLVIDIYLDNAYILARNRSNVVDSTLLPVVATATTDADGGKMNLNMQIDALVENPICEMNATLKYGSPVKHNGSFKAYAGFDVNIRVVVLKKNKTGLFIKVFGKPARKNDEKKD